VGAPTPPVTLQLQLPTTGPPSGADSRQLTQSGSRKRVRFASSEDEGHRLFGLPLPHLLPLFLPTPPQPPPSSHPRAQDASAATDLAQCPTPSHPKLPGLSLGVLPYP